MICMYIDCMYKHDSNCDDRKTSVTLPFYIYR